MEKIVNNSIECFLFVYITPITKVTASWKIAGTLQCCAKGFYIMTSWNGLIQ